jgi:tRNA threonylcarbamoyl adenosine modification protein YeaZ
MATATMRVLAIDTASPAPALALLDEARRAGEADEGVFRVEVEPLPLNAAEALARNLGILLDRAGLVLKDVDRIAVLSGPGSFTGLRAGTAFGRGLARALEIPLVLIPTFDAVSAAVAVPDPFNFILDAGRGEVHVAERREQVTRLLPRPIPRAEALVRLRQAGVSVRDLNADPLVLAPALARLGRDRSVKEPEEVFLGYGRRSAAEEKFGPAEGSE